MGCTCSREGTKIIVNQRMPGLNQFIIKIHIPKSENVKILFYNSAFDKEPIIDLINFFFFKCIPDNSSTNLPIKKILYSDFRVDFFCLIDMVSSM